MKLRDDVRKEIIEVVAMSFETGHIAFETYEDFKREYPNLDKDAWNFYNDLLSMGPAGFYQEFKDERTWDLDFVAEYGWDDFDYEDDDEYIDEVYHDYSEDELRAMGCFDNLNEEE